MCLPSTSSSGGATPVLHLFHFQVFYPPEEVNLCRMCLPSTSSSGGAAPVLQLLFPPPGCTGNHRGQVLNLNTLGKFKTKNPANGRVFHFESESYSAASVKVGLSTKGRSALFAISQAVTKISWALLANISYAIFSGVSVGLW